MLVHSPNGKLNSVVLVSQLDLYVMWSMIRRQRFNVAMELAFVIKQQAQISKKGLFCGAYITHTLKNINEFPKGAPEDEVGESLPMTYPMLNQWGISKIDDEDDSS